MLKRLEMLGNYNTSFLDSQSTLMNARMAVKQMVLDKKEIPTDELDAIAKYCKSKQYFYDWDIEWWVLRNVLSHIQGEKIGRFEIKEWNGKFYVCDGEEVPTWYPSRDGAIARINKVIRCESEMPKLMRELGIYDLSFEDCSSGKWKKRYFRDEMAMSLMDFKDAVNESPKEWNIESGYSEVRDRIDNNTRQYGPWIRIQTWWRHLEWGVGFGN